jgi:DNA recombination-dependent growth factor C
MTPKEKAQELFDKYYQIFEDDEDEHFIDTSKRISKLSALIAVDEIIEEVYNNESSISRYKYWQEVKQEIEKL